MWCFSTTFSAADKYANFREDFFEYFYDVSGRPFFEWWSDPMKAKLIVVTFDSRIGL
jgi:hypothetical protein